MVSWSKFSVREQYNEELYDGTYPNAVTTMVQMVAKT